MSWLRRIPGGSRQRDRLRGFSHTNIRKSNFTSSINITAEEHICIIMRPLFSVLTRSSPAAWTLPLRAVRHGNPTRTLDSICARCRLQQKRQFTQSRQLTDQGSLLNVDHPARLVRVNQKHGPGLILLGRFIPELMRLILKTDIC